MNRFPVGQTPWIGASVRLATGLVCIAVIIQFAHAAPASDVYYQSFKPRIANPLQIHRGAPCGNVGGVQQTEIMADRPRQAAMAALRNPQLAVEMADQAYTAAAEAELLRKATSVDLYFETVAFSWHFIASPNAAASPDYLRAWRLYHSGLMKLIQTGVQFGRLQPDRGLQVNTTTGTLLIPFTYHGFVWKPADFNRIQVAHLDKKQNSLQNEYSWDGLGVPLVVTRIRSKEERFFMNKTPFPATVVLRPSLAVLAGRAPPVGAAQSHSSLELYDPLRVSAISIDGRPAKLAGDLTAVFELATKEIKYTPIRAALNPELVQAKEQLFMIEPYQPGKYPLVFIHGLLSSPQVWQDMANEILARPDLRRHFQLWAYRYPTGKPFLESAAILRRELKAAIRQCNPAGQDPALYQTVLIGHSMGGLIAQLLVTSSDDTLWYSIANRPLNEIRASEKEREYLFKLFYFEPLPFVTRVVFIGTPHNGSSLASQAIGRCSSILIHQPLSRQIEHNTLIQKNPGVFSPEITNRLTNSVDLLRPNNPFLAAVQKLCPGPNVQLHSVIGTGIPSLVTGWGDGVVPVGSAEYPYVSTQKKVHSTHGNLHNNPAAIEEVLCILRRHIMEANEASEVDCNMQPAVDGF